MTTIATDGKTIASDSYITSDILVSRNTVKVFRIGDEYVGCRGDCDVGDAYMDWLRKGAKPKEKPKIEGEDIEFDAVHLNAKGEVFCVDGVNFAKFQVDVPYATGSGGPIALGAMLAGKSPEEAVAIAITVDIHSGGKVNVLRACDLPGGEEKAAGPPAT